MKLENREQILCEFIQKQRVWGLLGLFVRAPLGLPFLLWRSYDTENFLISHSPSAHHLYSSNHPISCGDRQVTGQRKNGLPLFEEGVKQVRHFLSGVSGLRQSLVFYSVWDLNLLNHCQCIGVIGLSYPSFLPFSAHCCWSFAQTFLLECSSGGRRPTLPAFRHLQRHGMVVVFSGTASSRTAVSRQSSDAKKGV